MIDDAISTVKGALALLEPYPKYADLAFGLKETLGFPNEQKRLSAPIPKSLGDLSDLPEELLRELSIPKTDELEDQIITVMRACDGAAGLDQVLVGLYRKFKVVQTRRFLQNKLYRMSKKELVYQVPGQRAAYSLDPQPTPPAKPNGGYDSGGYDEGGYDESPPPTRRPPSNDLDDEIPF